MIQVWNKILTPVARSQVLRVRDLSVRFPRPTNDAVLAVDSLSFKIAAGETLAIVGESGSGKTATCRAAVGLLPLTAKVQGEIWVDNHHMSKASPSAWRRIRGKVIAMALQDPAKCLNPTRPVGAQIADAVAMHLGYGGMMARREADELMDLLNIDARTSRYDAYPHELSGGMRQRIAIAVAIAGRPKLLIADESVRALDPIAKGATLKLLKNLQETRGMAIMLVSHNLYSLRGFADRILVMFAGRAVEQADAKSLLDSPQMPYTNDLLRATPSPAMHRGSFLVHEAVDTNHTPAPDKGCAYFARCAISQEHCKAGQPPLKTVSRDHEAACWLLTETAAHV